MNKFVIVIDCSTSACKSLLINKEGEIIDKTQELIVQHYPESGWCEQDPEEIWTKQLKTLRDLKSKTGFKNNEIAAIAISNQRETVIAWDSELKKPLGRAIVWQDRRTADYCKEIVKKGFFKKIQQKTGLIVNPYFSASKIHWLLENNNEVQESFRNKKLLIGTVDSWLIWKLTSGESFVTDVTNASRTMLFNIHTCQWDEELLSLFNIPKEILPTVKSNSALFGNFNSNFLSTDEASVNIPIYGVIGDQSASLLGNRCFKSSMAKNTYGTGCFLLKNIGNKAILSSNQLLTTIAWKIDEDETIFALEGSVFNAGTIVDWLSSDLGIISGGEDIDSICLKQIDDDFSDLYFVPAFNGLGAPYWDNNARGAILGIERFTNREDIVKSAIDSIAFQTNDLIKAMEQDVLEKTSVLHVDGGLTKSEYLMKFQSGISELKIKKFNNIDMSAMGAFYIAGLCLGWWSSLEESPYSKDGNQVFEVEFKKEKIQKLTSSWTVAIRKTLNWKGEML